MSLQSNELIKRLSGAGLGALARTSGVTQSGQGGAAAGPDFAKLLRSAGSGGVSSELPVQVSKQSGLELSSDQLDRLGRAADRAEAAGLTSALVVIDGQALTLDVQTRTITGRFDSTSTGRVGHFDGVIAVPTAEQESDAQVLPVPGGTNGTAAGNASLNKLLESLERATLPTGAPVTGTRPRL